MKRIVLFLLTNLAVGVVLTVVLSLLGADRFLAGSGLNVPMLAVFSVVVGFVGSFFSLAISKPMAKFSMGVHVIDAPQTADEQWLVSTLHPLADNAGVVGPALCVLEKEPPTFPAGALQNISPPSLSPRVLP